MLQGENQQVANNKNGTDGKVSVDTARIDLNHSVSSLKAIARLLARSAARAAFEAHQLKKDEADHELQE